MPDVIKVIKGLECCKWSRQNVKPEKNKCDECPYKDQGIMNAFSVWRSCTNVLAGDALALLKEQPAIVRCKDCGHQGNRGLGAYYMFIECKKTGSIHHETWFCANGKAVKEND